MAVKIRLMRVGKKKQPTYRVVVADARSPRDGRFIEILGQYAPRQEPSLVTIDSERALHWLNAGAQPTESAAEAAGDRRRLGRVQGRERQGRGVEAEGEGRRRRRSRKCPPPRPRRPPLRPKRPRRSRGRRAVAVDAPAEAAADDAPEA